MSTTPAICGQEICGQTICGQTAIDLSFEDKSVSFADHGENPKINLSTGRLMYEQAEISVGGGNYAIGISHIYNSKQNGNVAYCGMGWKLNVYQRLISKSDGTYKYIDGSGGVNTFVLFDSANARYYNTIDAGQVLTVATDGSAVIQDGAGNKTNFNANGYISSVISALNGNIKKTFVYDDFGRVVRIYDARLKFSDKIKTYITFEYDQSTGLLKSISAYDKYTQLVDRYIYEYDTNEYRSKDFEYLKLSFLVFDSDEKKVSLAKSITKALKKNGVDVSLKIIEKDNFTSTLSEGDYDMYLGEVKLTEDMSLSSFFTKGQSLSYGIDTSSAAAKAYFDFKAGKIDITTFAKVFDEYKPFLPICYKKGVAYYSRELRYEGAASENDIFSNIYSWGK